MLTCAHQINTTSSPRKTSPCYERYLILFLKLVVIVAVNRVRPEVELRNFKGAVGQKTGQYLLHMLPVYLEISGCPAPAPARRGKTTVS